MKYVRHPTPKQNGLRKKAEAHLGEKVYYSWEIALILENLGMDGVYQHLHRKSKTNEPDWPAILGQIESKVKNNLRSAGFNSKNLPEYNGRSINGVVLYPEHQVWEYIKMCESKKQIYPVEEDSLEKIIRKEYHHQSVR